MFTAIAQKNGAVAEKYFDEHLSHNDYYAQKEIRPGQWIGVGVEKLGLQEGAVVNRNEFLALCDNRHPTTDETLTQRRNQPGNRRLYYDFTCSAPKSVSVLAVTMQDERIVNAHQNAARIALNELQQFAATRVRTDGQTSDRITGNLVGAQFVHTSSRALDPQLHTHFVLFNCTYDSQEKRWKALEASRMYDAIQFGTEVYRNELAKELKQLGYEIERMDKGFEIRGVSKSILKQFSKRAGDRDRAVSEMEQKLGRKLTNNEVSHVIHKTRQKKLKGVNQAEVRQLQLNQLSEPEKEVLRGLVSKTDATCQAHVRISEEQALQFAHEHVFERQSVIPEHKLLQTALAHGCGDMSLDKLKDAIRTAPDLVKVGAELSTREILRTELFLIDSVAEGKGAAAPISPRYEPIDKELGSDQRKAASFILKSSDQITGIRGLAGTGKSRTLKELFRAFDQANRHTIICAPTGSAAENLRKDSLPAITLQRLLSDQKLQSELSARSIVVVDEAAMVGLDEMRRLVELTKKSNARLILCGDTGQHSSVTRGDALRILEKYSPYSFAELSVIRRQKKAPAYLSAVRKAANREPQRAFDLLERGGAIVESNEIYGSASKAYLKSLKENRSALLISPTWNEIHALTERVRTEMKQNGSLGSNEQNIAVLDSLSWTKAEKKTVSRYRPGQFIVFHRKNGQFPAGESVTILVHSKGALLIRRADGTEIAFRPTQPDKFDVCQSKELPVAPGERLLLQAPRREGNEQFVNGEIVRVKSVEGGVIKLEDGRTLPRQYRNFTHGYAVTSQAAQSKTVDDVFVVASSSSAPAIHARQFYVDISRGRETCKIFTDDRELLRHRICDPRDRKAAIELSGLDQALAKAGLGSAPKVDDLEKSPGVKSPFRALSRLVDLRLPPVQRLTRLIHQFAKWRGMLSAKAVQPISRRPDVRQLINQNAVQKKGVRIC